MGEPVKLEFAVAEMAECRIRWYHNGRQVENGPRSRVTSAFGVHTLILPCVDAGDAGLYKVVVESAAGNAEMACDLVVEGFICFLFAGCWIQCQDCF